MTNTTNYGFNIVEGTDVVNPLVQLNPNFTNLDSILKGVSDSTISPATCIKSGTTHTITRSNTDANVLRFTATGNWDAGDTMIVDGVTVSPFLSTGEALTTGAYLINTEVIIALNGTRATVYSNQSSAASTAFNDASVSYTASNVQTAIENASTATGTEYTPGVNVKQKIDNIFESAFQSIPSSDIRCINGAVSIVLPANATSVAVDVSSLTNGAISYSDYIISANFKGNYTFDTYPVGVRNSSTNTSIALKFSNSLNNDTTLQLFYTIFYHI